MDIRKLQRAIVDGLEDVKAQHIVVFNTEHLSPLFERVIVASGTSNRQTKALAASVRDAVKSTGMPVLRTEGEDNGEWIIVDCGAAVAHIMQPAIRDYYRLEEIWGGKPVKLKLGSEKTSLPKASEGPDDEGEDEAPVKKKPAAKKAAAHSAATEKSAAGRAALGDAKAKRRNAGDGASAVPKKPAPARKVTSGRATGAAAAPAKKVVAKKAPAKAPVKASAKAPARKAAPAKKAAPARKAPAARKAAPARKSSSR
jgi:ribosome-associated protein